MATTTLERLRGADFLNIADLDRDQLRGLLDLARRIKAGEWSQTPLRGRHLAMLFQKPSLRTRVSFQVGIERLGGQAVVLSEQEIGLGRREPAADIARVLDRYVHGIVARLNRHQDLVDLASAAGVPVINALTDASHPCQVLADLLTIEERLGRLDATLRIAFVGDGNNVVASLMEASTLLGFELIVVSPPAYRPLPEAVARAPRVTVTGDLGAVAGADVVYTDVWTSMGQEAERETRQAQFAEYQVDMRLLDMAPAAIFMHCLPAHRGEEVAADVLESPRSVVFEQAGNRLHAQMALMAAVF